MKSNFHLLFTSDSEKTTKEVQCPYMRITVNGKRADMSTGREANPSNGTTMQGVSLVQKKKSNLLTII